MTREQWDSEAGVASFLTMAKVVWGALLSWWQSVQVKAIADIGLALARSGLDQSNSATVRQWTSQLGMAHSSARAAVVSSLCVLLLECALLAHYFGSSLTVPTPVKWHQFCKVWLLTLVPFYFTAKSYGDLQGMHREMSEGKLDSEPVYQALAATVVAMRWGAYAFSAYVCFGILVLLAAIVVRWTRPPVANSDHWHL